MRHELHPLLAPGARAGVFLDFDGTLSEIVRVASDARPVEGARELLAKLAARVEVVAIVSGRVAGELLEWLGPEVEIWGVHGAERTLGGRVVLSDAVRAHAPLMARVRQEAEQALSPHGVAVEDKTVVITLHYRDAPDRTTAARVAEEVARDLAARHGLTTEPGRASIELRPPVELSKAAVVSARAREAELSAALFAGDDTGDLPAFDALDELARAGLRAVRVAVRSDESPPELLRRADIVVDGPGGVLALLHELAGAP